MAALRTQQEFDAFLSNAGGDPWKYNSPRVVTRLQRSLAFLLRHFPAEQTLTALELGAFNGDFTRLLSATYTNGQIVATDISEVAIADLRARLASLKNVTVFREDLLHIRASQLPSPPDVVLLMECLYYLDGREQRQALDNLRAQFPGAAVVVSAPMIGGHYFTRATLDMLFLSAGYTARDSDTVSLRFGASAALFQAAHRSKAARAILEHQAMCLYRPVP